MVQSYSLLVKSIQLFFNSTHVPHRNTFDSFRLLMQRDTGFWVSYCSSQPPFLFLHPVGQKAAAVDILSRYIRLPGSGTARAGKQKSKKIRAPAQLFCRTEALYPHSAYFSVQGITPESRAILHCLHALRVEFLVLRGGIVPIAALRAGERDARSP